MFFSTINFKPCLRVVINNFKGIPYFPIADEPVNSQEYSQHFSNMIIYVQGREKQNDTGFPNI